MRLTVTCTLTAMAVLFVAAKCGASELAEQPVTVLVNGKALPIDSALVDGPTLWLTSDDVTKVDGFKPEPQGFCAGEVCVPIPASSDWQRQQGDRKYYNVTRFADKVSQAVAPDEAHSTWSFGAVPMLQSELYPSGIAPDFALSDRDGKTVRLSDFLGKKVLILTWASW
jgi:hypothetical protein